MRGLKTDLETPPGARGGAVAGSPSEAAPPAASSASGPAPAPAETAPSAARPVPLARTIENAVAAVVAGSPSRLLLCLADEGGELAASFDEVLETTRRRALHVRLAPGAGLAERALAGLVPALGERHRGRPGVAALLDPLIKSAASFVLGKDLASLESFLAPEALDEVPAVAKRVLLTRFVPALAAQLPEVPRELLAALVEVRTGPGSTATADPTGGTLSPSELLHALAVVAASAGGAIVFSCPDATESAAANALEAATALGTAPAGVLWALGCAKSAWDVQRALLDDGERARIEDAVRVSSPAPPAAATPAPSVAAPTPAEAPAAAPNPGPSAANAPRILAPRARAAAARRAPPPSAPGVTPLAMPRVLGLDETPPLAIPKPLKLKKELAERVRRAVVAKLARRKAILQPSRPAKSATASTSASLSAFSATVSNGTARLWGAPAGVADAKPSRVKRAVLTALPFIFLASLGIFARRDEVRPRASGPTPEWMLKLARARGVAAPATGNKTAPAAATPTPVPAAAAAPPPAAAAPSPAKVAPAQPVGRGRPRRGGAPLAAQKDPRPAAAPSMSERLQAAEREPQGPAQLSSLCEIYDSKQDSPGDQSLLQRGVLLRLAPYRTEQAALDRIMGSLDASNPRDVRLTAISALTMGTAPLPAAARTTLESLAQNEPDEAVRSSAQVALAQAH
jgi:hypothetical protein